MKIGSIKGVKLSISPLFLLLCSVEIWFGTYEIFLAVAALIIHELAHASVAFITKVRMVSIEFFPLGAQILTETMAGAEPQKEMGVALAGPLASLFLAGLTYIMKGNLDMPGFSFFMQFNLLLGCFNLLPAVPLDGGRAVRALLSMRLGYRTASRVLLHSGLLLAFVLLGAGVYLSIREWLAINFVFAAIFLGYKDYIEYKMLPYSMTRYLIHKNMFLMENRAVPVILMSCRSNAQVGMVIGHSRPGTVLLILVLEPGQPQPGFVLESQLIEAFIEQGPAVTLAELLDR